MSKIKVAVAGCLGRMGQELTKEILKNKKSELEANYQKKLKKIQE